MSETTEYLEFKKREYERIAKERNALLAQIQPTLMQIAQLEGRMIELRGLIDVLSTLDTGTSQPPDLSPELVPA